jgi:hypothetical protein
MGVGPQSGCLLARLGVHAAFFVAHGGVRVLTPSGPRAKGARATSPASRVEGRGTYAARMPPAAASDFFMWTSAIIVPSASGMLRRRSAV